MNTWQLCKQLKDLLQAREWEGDSGNIVFASSSVFSTAGPIDDDALGNRRTPFAMIYVLGSQVDPTMNELPGLLRQEIGVRLAVSVPGDAVGENPLMGANPTGTNPYTSSKGRGLLEVQEELLATIEYLGNSNGINIQSRASSAVASSVQQDNEYVCARDYTFEALVTSSRSYPPARGFAPHGPGMGPMTDADFKIYLSIVPDLGKTAEGNQLIMLRLEREFEGRQILARILREQLQGAGALGGEAIDEQKAWREVAAELNDKYGPLVPTFESYEALQEQKIDYVNRWVMYKDANGKLNPAFVKP